MPSAGVVLGCILGSIVGSAAIIFVAYAALILYVRRFPESTTARMYTDLRTKSEPPAQLKLSPPQPLDSQGPRSSMNSNKPLPGVPTASPPGHLSFANRRTLQSARLVTVSEAGDRSSAVKPPLSIWPPANPFLPHSQSPGSSLLNYLDSDTTRVRDQQQPQLSSHPSSAATTSQPQPPQPVATRLSTQIDSMIGATVNNGTIVVARAPIDNPRPAPPVPASAQPYRKDPTEHTRHVSQPSLRSSQSGNGENSAHASLDERTLPSTLLLGDRPQELETPKPSRKSRVWSFFSPKQSSQSPKKPKNDQQLVQSSPREPSPPNVVLPNQTLANVPLPQLLPPLEFNNLDMNFSSMSLAKDTPPEPELRIPGRFKERVTEPSGHPNRRAPQQVREFDFELSSICGDNEKESRPVSQTSSHFSGYRVAMSATLEDLREEYRGSGLNLAYHTKDEYQQLAELSHNSSEGSPVVGSCNSSSESIRTITLASPIQLNAEPLTPASHQAPGMYDVRPLCISKTSLP